MGFDGKQWGLAHALNMFSSRDFYPQRETIFLIFVIGKSSLIIHKEKKNINIKILLFKKLK